MGVYLPASLELIPPRRVGWWKIGAWCHAVPYFVQAAAKVFIEHVNRFLIYTCCAVFTAYFQIALIYHPLTYCKWLCLFFAHHSIVHGCLQILTLNNCIPSLHRHYSNFIATMDTSDAAYHIFRLWQNCITIINLSSLILPWQWLTPLVAIVLWHISKQPLTFRINACVMLLPPQYRKTCNLSIAYTLLQPAPADAWKSAVSSST